jgi:hypothetical protein
MRNSLRAIIATVGLMASMAVVQATLPGIAQARCKGVGNEITSTLIINGVVAVSEVPVTGTCNDNAYYQANFRSHHAGWRASVWLERNGWVGHWGPYGTDWQYYNFNDKDTPIPGTASIHLCLDNGTTWYCGWGSDYTLSNGPNHNITGVNYGF